MVRRFGRQHRADGGGNGRGRSFGGHGNAASARFRGRYREALQRAHLYIRKNAKPEKRLELRLVVNAGSVLEDEDSRGIAHFCEHMAFNGTERFKKHELTDYLESIGMRFGPELNAYTGFDETVYMLQVPTDSAGWSRPPSGYSRTGRTG